MYIHRCLLCYPSTCCDFAHIALMNLPNGNPWTQQDKNGLPVANCWQKVTRGLYRRNKRGGFKKLAAKKQDVATDPLMALDMKI